MALLPLLPTALLACSGAGLLGAVAAAFVVRPRRERARPSPEAAEVPSAALVPVEAATYVPPTNVPVPRPEKTATRLRWECPLEAPASGDEGDEGGDAPDGPGHPSGAWL